MQPASKSEAAHANYANPSVGNKYEQSNLPVGIVEYFCNLHTLGCLCEAHHVIRTADFDEGEAGFGGKLGCQGGLTRIGCTL